MSIDSYLNIHHELTQLWAMGNDDIIFPDEGEWKKDEEEMLKTKIKA